MNLKTLILTVSLLVLSVNPVYAWRGQSGQDSNQSNISTSLRSIVQELEPSVVWVLADLGSNCYSRGSGFIIDEDGYLITTAHVIEDATGKIWIGWPSKLGREATTAKITAVDYDLDLALLYIEWNEESDLVPLTIDPTEKVFIGDEVVALGFPFDNSWNLQELTVTRGIVSSFIMGEGNDHIETIKTDAVITLGHSGGPLYNLSTGKVIGILQTKGLNILEGFNFAIPVRRIFEFSGTSPELGIEIAICQLRRSSRSQLIDLLNP